MHLARSLRSGILLWSIALATSGTLVAHAQHSDLFLYDFSSDYQGWLLQYVERQYVSTGELETRDYLPFSPREWSDESAFPYPPGADPLGDSRGAFVLGLRLAGVQDDVNIAHQWDERVYLQSEDAYTHSQSGWPEGYEQHPDYTGSWPFGHYGSIGAIAEQTVDVRVYCPDFTHGDDPVWGAPYSVSGGGDTFLLGNQTILHTGWNVLSLESGQIADLDDLRAVGVQVEARRPVHGELMVDRVTLGEVTAASERYIYLLPDQAHLSQEADYNARELEIRFDDAGSHAAGVRGFHLVLEYPADCVRIDTVRVGALFDGWNSLFTTQVDSIAGRIEIDGAILGPTSGVRLHGSLAVLELQPANGSTPSCSGGVSFIPLECELRDPDNAPLEGIFFGGQAIHDVSPPSVPILTCASHNENEYSDANDLQVSWPTCADDGVPPVGMRGFYLLLDPSPVAVPEPRSAQYSWHTPWSPDSVEFEHRFEDVPDGTWYVHAVASDWLWNVSTVSTIGPFHIDTVAPENITGLLADVTDDADLSVDLTWANPPSDFSGVRIFRKGFGNYPEYDDPPDPGSEPPWPDSPDGALADGWTEIYQGVGSSFVDSPAERDDYFYAAFAYDEVPNYAAAHAEAQDHSLCYWLGDFTALGSLTVDIYDVLVLSLAYNTAEGHADYNNICDIGPTIDHGRQNRPTTDNEIEFEDLIVLANNYENTTNGRSDSDGEPLPTLRASLVVSPLGQDEYEVRIYLLDNPGRLRGASVKVALGSSIEVLHTAAGSLWSETEHFFHGDFGSDGHLWFDAVAWGTTVEEDGCHATARIRWRSGESAALTGGPPVRIVNLRARDPQNRNLATTQAPQGLPVDEEDDLGTRAHPELRAHPTPMLGRTVFSYHLARASEVRIAIWDATGRRVRTFSLGSQAPGHHEVAWDGLDEGKQPIPPGIYFYRFDAGLQSATRKIVCIR